MAGINLSQSLQEKQAQVRGRFFDRSFFWTIGGFVLLLGAFGATHWYVGTLDQKMQELDQTIAEKTASLRGKEVNRVTDFVHRLDVIQSHLANEPDPTEGFKQLEMYTLPAVRLTTYKYDRGAGTLLLDGIASNLKEVAQQMLAFKNMESTDEITVDNISYDDSGKVRFSFLLKQSAASESVRQ